MNPTIIEIPATMLKSGHRIVTHQPDGTTRTRRVTETTNTPGVVYYRTDADRYNPRRWPGWQVPATRTLKVVSS